MKNERKNKKGQGSNRIKSQRHKLKWQIGRLVYLPENLAAELLEFNYLQPRKASSSTSNSPFITPKNASTSTEKVAHLSVEQVTLVTFEHTTMKNCA
jgi:hypothetical protein